MGYLKEHNTGEKYLFAAMDYGTAGPYIIDEGEQVVILNGFNASDTPYTPDTLKALVASGQVKYFLVTNGGMGGGVAAARRLRNGLPRTARRFRPQTGREHRTAAMPEPFMR